MILVGSQRGGARNLAIHLMKPENEHVELHELRGFASDTLMGALNESYAISRGTRCKQHLYSLSLNPPPGEKVSIGDFEATIDRVEAELGLGDQPRAIVFHEKEGRRHCHAVWSRIDAHEMKAVPLPFTKRKLMEISRELYLERGWAMPKGLTQSQERDPQNFTLAEWQQAKRADKDAREVKAAFQDAWAISDSRDAFAQALKSRGYWLAQGDRRGFVALDMSGEVYAVARWTGLKTKDVRARLGPSDALPTLAEAKADMARMVVPRLKQLRLDQEKQLAGRQSAFEERRMLLVTRQRDERQRLGELHQRRQAEEAKQRQARFRHGLAGLWDRLRGEHRRIRRLNEQDAASAARRDRSEKDQLVFRQLEQRRDLAKSVQKTRAEFRRTAGELSLDISRLQDRENGPSREKPLDQIRRRGRGRSLP